MYEAETLTNAELAEQLVRTIVRPASPDHPAPVMDVNLPERDEFPPAAHDHVDRVARLGRARIEIRTQIRDLQAEYRDALDADNAALTAAIAAGTKPPKATARRLQDQLEELARQPHAIECALRGAMVDLLAATLDDAGTWLATTRDDVHDAADRTRHALAAYLEQRAELTRTAGLHAWLADLVDQGVVRNYQPAAATELPAEFQRPLDVPTALDALRADIDRLEEETTR